MEEQYISIKKASCILKLNPHTVRKYCRDGIFDCKRVKNTRGSKIYVNVLSIPAFLRRTEKSLKV